MQKLRKECFDLEEFHLDILEWIKEQNYWNIWVPKKYGGKELDLSEGLKLLRNLAFLDGSLGWTITLCSGANYFVGNLEEKAAREIFSEGEAILGGSGAVGGIAEKQANFYRISGKWKYATGSHYLTHFTLNAKIHENGRPVKDENGEELVCSFVIPRNDVTIIQDWKTMGLQATVTNSFRVQNAIVPEHFSFKYDKFFSPQEIFKIPFQSFADLTLWVNYIGMADHFLEEANEKVSSWVLKDLKFSINKADNLVSDFSEKITDKIKSEQKLPEAFIREIHSEGAQSIQQLSRCITGIFPKLGIAAATRNSQLNLIFRDFFTATQHHNFSK